MSAKRVYSLSLSLFLYRKVQRMKETRVTDGATLRHSRIMRMLQWILEVEGATIGDIRSMMLMNYGLKYRTTSDYVYECWQAGSLRLSQDGRYIVSARFKKYIK